MKQKTKPKPKRTTATDDLARGLHASARNVLFIPVDGTLVDVCKGLFILVVHYFHISPFPGPPKVEPPHTVERVGEAFGLTPMQIRVLRNIVRATPNWYLDLPPVPGADAYAPRLRELAHKGQVVFCIDRLETEGKGVREQAEAWLRRHLGIQSAMIWMT